MHFTLLSRPRLVVVRRLRIKRVGAIVFKYVKILLAFFLIVQFLDISQDFLFRPRPDDTHSNIKPTAQDLVAQQHTTSVYIASSQYNSEALLRERWIPSLVELVKELQNANVTVYVSIYESGSVDGTKAALSELGEALEGFKIDHTIKLDEETHATAIAKTLASPHGWLRTLYGKEMRRIVYLADVRNQALKPLHNLNKAGVTFDKILFLNDVVFSVLYFFDFQTMLAICSPCSMVLNTDAAFRQRMRLRYFIRGMESMQRRVDWTF